MTNDPTTTPGGEADLSQTGKTGRVRSGGRVSYPEMLGGGTEEQNMNQVGDPSTVNEPRTFLDKDQARQMADKAKDATAETLSTLTDKVNALRDQLQHSAETARDWAKKQADSTADTAKRLQAERPVMVLSVSAGAALAVGLLAGFVIGRATADEY